MKKFIVLLMMSLTLIPATAQQPNGRRFNMEEFKARAIKYLTQKACLTQDEANAFFPIYEEFKTKQRDIQKQIQQLKKDSPNNNDEAEKSVIRIAELNKECSSLEVTYYKKICKIIPAQKFLKIIHAEDEFHRNMVRNFNRPQPKRGER